MLLLTPLTWVVVITALVVGILAGHFGWGRRFTNRFTKLHPDYLAGLDYLVTEQPDRALDTFLKLMDANSETLETHFALGSLYRRRGEVERAIRIHQNLLARETLAPEHREQALLALAHDYLRAGLLDRAEELFLQVTRVPRLEARALDSLRGVYERQLEWQQALDVFRRQSHIGAAPPSFVAAHYLCELATVAIEAGDHATARRLLRDARRDATPFPRAAVLRARIAERDGACPLAVRLLRWAMHTAPSLLQEELPHVLRLAPAEEREALLREIVQRVDPQDSAELKRLVFAAVSAGMGSSPSLEVPITRVLSEDEALGVVWAPTDAERDARHAARRFAVEIGALLESADKYRCGECGFSSRHFYWHCPACHAWESFEAFAIVKLG